MKSRNRIQSRPLITTICATLAVVSAALMTVAGESSAVRGRVIELLSSQEFKEERREILSLGERAYPTLTKVLSSPQQYGALRVKRALIILRDLQGDTKPFIEHVKNLSFSEDETIRYRAVMALEAVGGTDDVPDLVRMLSDDSEPIRVQSIVALGKLGDLSSLEVLRAWMKQAEFADKSRNPKDKWVTRRVVKAIDQATELIQQRQKSKN